MSASHYRWALRAVAAVTVAGAIAIAGCASQAGVRPDLPDQGVLDPATQALDKAVSAHADQFAPRIVDSARRRLTVARDILFSAAEADRALSDAEDDRVQALVDQARLDARAALTKTQAGAVQRQLERLQGRGQSLGPDQGQGSADDRRASSDNPGSQGLGIPAFGSANATPGSSQ